MPNYESLLIFEPQLSDEEINDLLEKTKKIVTGEGGEILGEDRWGRRKLSYPIRRNREGNYIQIKFAGGPAILSKLDHFCKVNDAILRNMVVRLKPAGSKEKKTK